MNTILASTDFSNASVNAVAYAAELALQLNARLILFHVYPIPVITSEAPISIPPLDEIEKNCLQDLEDSAKKTGLETGGRLKIECLCKCGFVAEEIAAAVKEKKADLVVMGMQGAGYVGENLSGSITTEFIKDSVCPVLSIPEKVKFTGLKHIVLACDYSEKFKSDWLKPLKELAVVTGSRVFVLNVVQKAVLINLKGQGAEEDQIDFSLGPIDHSFHRVHNEDAVEGINTFAASKKADLVVLIPHKLSFFAGLFHKRHTKEIAFHSNIPLLTLPEC